MTFSGFWSSSCSALGLGERRAIKGSGLLSFPKTNSPPLAFQLPGSHQTRIPVQTWSLGLAPGFHLGKEMTKVSKLCQASPPHTHFRGHLEAALCWEQRER